MARNFKGVCRRTGARLSIGSPQGDRRMRPTRAAALTRGSQTSSPRSWTGPVPP